VVVEKFEFDASLIGVRSVFLRRRRLNSLQLSIIDPLVLLRYAAVIIDFTLRVKEILTLYGSACRRITCADFTLFHFTVTVGTKMFNV